MIPALTAIGGLVAAIAAAFVSVRLLAPRQKLIVAQAGDVDSQRLDRLMARYEHVVEQQDEKLRHQDTQIAELVEAERACEERADLLADRVSQLEAVLAAHGLTAP